MKSFHLQPPSTPSPITPQSLALACTFLAWLFSIVLISQSWKFTLIFALIAVVAALRALRRPTLPRADRTTSQICLILSALAIVLTIRWPF